MLKVFHSQKCPIFDWIESFFLFMFSEDFEALIYDFGGILIILTPNLSFIKACPLFYKQNIQRLGSFKDRPIFRCYFLLWICKKSKETKDFQKSYSNQLLKFVFSILAAKWKNQVKHVPKCKFSCNLAIKVHLTEVAK